jgi:hypothetical protein
MSSRFPLSLSFAATYERWPLLTSNFRPATPLFVTSAWLITIILKFLLYLLLEPDEIWELVDRRF